MIVYTYIVPHSGSVQDLSQIEVWSNSQTSVLKIHVKVLFRQSPGSLGTKHFAGALRSGLAHLVSQMHIGYARYKLTRMEVLGPQAV